MKLYKKVVLSAITLAAFAGVANAQTIGIDFYNGGTSVSQSPLPTDVVGPNASAGWNNDVDLTNPPTSYYNQFNTSDHGSPVTLKDNTGPTGTTTTATFGFVNFGLSPYNGGNTQAPSYGSTGSVDPTLTADQQLYNGATNAGAGGVTSQVTLNDIPYAQYSVYVLVDAATGNAGFANAGVGSVEMFDGGLTATAPAGTTYWFSSNGNTTPILGSGFSYIQTTSTDQANPTIGGNYALFSGLTNPTVTFDISAPPGSFDNGAFFGGLEIVNTTPTAAPEPSTYALMLGGLFALAGMRRMRNRSV